MTDATRLADRALIRLSGEDVRDFLQGLVTNDVRALDAGPVWAGLLTAQGKALFDFLLWADGADVLVDAEASQVEALVRRLTLYRLRRAIAIAVEPGLAVHWSTVARGGAVPDPRLDALGYRWLAPAGDARAADAAWRVHRLRLGVPEGVAELGGDRSLWLETNAGELNGVSFTKGCYVGQENTARMNWRQKVNRRLVVVETEGDPGEAARVWYADPGLAVAQLRVDTLRDGGPDWGRAIVPDWLAHALAAPAD